MALLVVVAFDWRFPVDLLLRLELVDAEADMDQTKTLFYKGENIFLSK